ncbi:uncharacterized protein [Paramormyrops kingsleyae]|uniref:uncharacterized protein isoform X2 n=1 Tax=Paramormyrops kingsleyae TaxID=1676925 RepID=UPI003B976B0A
MPKPPNMDKYRHLLPEYKHGQCKQCPRRQLPPLKVRWDMPKPETTENDGGSLPQPESAAARHARLRSQLPRLKTYKEMPEPPNMDKYRHLLPEYKHGQCKQCPRRQLPPLKVRWDMPKPETTENDGGSLPQPESAAARHARLRSQLPRLKTYKEMPEPPNMDKYRHLLPEYKHGQCKQCPRRQLPPLKVRWDMPKPGKTEKPATPSRANRKRPGPPCLTAGPPLKRAWLDGLN